MKKHEKTAAVAIQIVNAALTANVVNHASAAPIANAVRTASVGPIAAADAAARKHKASNLRAYVWRD